MAREDASRARIAQASTTIERRTMIELAVVRLERDSVLVAPTELHQHVVCILS